MMAELSASSKLTKAQIRAAVLARRDTLPASVRAQSSSVIVGDLIRTEEFRSANSVMAYCSFRSEVDTAPLLKLILDSGKTLILPKVDRTEDVLEIYEVKDLKDDLGAGVWEITEPLAEHCERSTVEQVDLIVVPGVAFDRVGNRIGYGKGYYDRLLGECRANTVAMAFDVQICSVLPVEPHDIPINLIITENEFIKRIEFVA